MKICTFCGKRPATRPATHRGPFVYCVPCSLATRACSMFHRERFDVADSYEVAGDLWELRQNVFAEITMLREEPDTDARRAYLRGALDHVREIEHLINFVEQHREAWLQAQIDTNTIADDPDFIERFLAPPGDTP